MATKTKYVTVKTLAKMLPFSEQKIRRLAREGKIPSKKFGSEYYFDFKHFEIEDQ